jgi:hypothetical protein
MVIGRELLHRSPVREIAGGELAEVVMAGQHLGQDLRPRARPGKTLSSRQTNPSSISDPSSASRAGTIPFPTAQRNARLRPFRGRSQRLRHRRRQTHSAEGGGPDTRRGSRKRALALLRG